MSAEQEKEIGASADGSGAAAASSGVDGNKKEKRWFPLEANPAVMNKYCEV